MNILKKQREEEIKRKERKAAEYATRQEFELQKDLNLSKKPKDSNRGPAITELNPVGAVLLQHKIDMLLSTISISSIDIFIQILRLLHCIALLGF